MYYGLPPCFDKLTPPIILSTMVHCLTVRTSDYHRELTWVGLGAGYPVLKQRENQPPSTVLTCVLHCQYDIIMIHSVHSCFIIVVS